MTTYFDSVGRTIHYVADGELPYGIKQGARDGYAFTSYCRPAGKDKGDAFTVTSDQRAVTCKACQRKINKALTA